MALYIYITFGLSIHFDGWVLAIVKNAVNMGIIVQHHFQDIKRSKKRREGKGSQHLPSTH